MVPTCAPSISAPLWSLILLVVSFGHIEAQEPVAFTNVNVVPMDREVIIPDQTVIVREGRIVEIGPASLVTIPEGARRIEGTARYLMPGLTDMHVHLPTGRDLLLYLANGVTTIRVMSGAPRILARRDSITRGELLGPTLYTTGPIIDGSPPTWSNSTIVDAAEEAEPVVREQKEAGYDFMLKAAAMAPMSSRRNSLNLSGIPRLPIRSSVSPHSESAFSDAE